MICSKRWRNPIPPSTHPPTPTTPLVDYLIMKKDWYSSTALVQTESSHKQQQTISTQHYGSKGWRLIVTLKE